jgi:hypothetical protein
VTNTSVRSHISKLDGAKTRIKAAYLECQTRAPLVCGYGARRKAFARFKDYRFCEGFRMPAVHQWCRVLRRPAYENPPREETAGEVHVWGRRALTRSRCSLLRSDASAIGEPTLVAKANTATLDSDQTFEPLANARRVVCRLRWSGRSDAPREPGSGDRR